MNKIIDFIRKHRIILIILVIYIIAYLLSIRFPAWLDYEAYANAGNDLSLNNVFWKKRIQKRMLEEAGGGYMSIFRIPLPPNRFLRLLPLNFFYFGIEEIAAAVYYDIGISVALLTYASLFVRWILERIFSAVEEKPGKGEQVLINFLLSSAVYYPVCFLVRLLDGHLQTWETQLIDTANQTPLFGIVYLLIMLCAVVFLAIPTLDTYLHYFLYIIVFKIIGRGITFLDQQPLTALFGSAQLPREIVTFLLSLFLLLLSIYLLERIYQFGQQFALLPAKWTTYPARRLIKKIADKFTHRTETDDDT